MLISALPNFHLYLCVGEQSLRSKEKELGLGTHGVSGVYGSTIHIIRDNQPYSAIVYLDSLNGDNSEIIATLAHEATHVMQRYLEWMGEKKAGREIQAYLVGGITKFLVDQWQNIKKE